MPDFPIARGTLWRHFKGGVYRILHIALMEGTREDVVVYMNVTEHGADLPVPQIWVRPVNEWREFVEIPGGTGTKITRFSPLFIPGVEP